MPLSIDLFFLRCCFSAPGARARARAPPSPSNHHRHYSVKEDKAFAAGAGWPPMALVDWFSFSLGQSTRRKEERIITTPTTTRIRPTTTTTTKKTPAHTDTNRRKRESSADLEQAKDEPWMLRSTQQQHQSTLEKQKRAERDLLSPCLPNKSRRTHSNGEKNKQTNDTHTHTKKERNGCAHTHTCTCTL